jgi:transposase
VSTNAMMDTSGGERRRYRSWPERLKREIVAASLAPGASVSLVARRYDVNTNQLFHWRKLYRDGLLGGADASGPALVPVTVVPDPVRGGGAARLTDRIEIELAGGYRVHVGSGVDGGTLRLVLDVLERR